MRLFHLVLLTLVSTITNAYSSYLSDEMLSFDNDSPQIRSITFHEKSYAWLITKGGDLLKTEDAGSTWKKISSTVVDGFRPVSFIDKNRGWMIGRLGDVWNTSDSGNRWKTISKLEPYGKIGFFTRQINFIDEMNGWVIELPNILWRTIDGGKNWNRSTPAHQNLFDALFNISRVNRKLGWISCDNGAALFTEDGGKNWQRRLLGYSQEAIFKIFFADKNHGWAIIGTKILATSNGGQSWKPQLNFAERAPMVSFFFLNKSEGWALGIDYHTGVGSSSIKDMRGIIFHTDNGGETWVKLKVPSTEGFYTKIWFSDSMSGWVVSRDKVYRTENGGKDWLMVLSLPSQQVK